MKGKLAFVLGAAVGYVLGTRAGRERYEQIKRGAQQVWETEPVQRGVEFVREAIDERTDGIRAFVGRVGADVFSNFAQPKARPSASTDATPASTSEPATGEGRDGDAPAPASKPRAKPSTAKRSTAKRTPKAES